MTPIQEMVITLFSDDVINQAKKQIKSGTEITGIKSFGVEYRLVRVNDRTINLEVLASRPFGSPVKTEMGMLIKTVSYSKPIGVYDIVNGFFSSKVSIKILFEFEKVYELLVSDSKLLSKYEVTNFTLKENLVIAAFSMDAVAEATNMVDKNLKINGLDVEIVMAFGGYPQLFADDSYNINGPIAAYFVEDPNSLNPIINYKELFDKLDSEKLLSAYSEI